MIGPKVPSAGVVATILDHCHDRLAISTVLDLALRDGRYGADERRAIEAAAKVKLSVLSDRP
jgi:hypothetical protein